MKTSDTAENKDEIVPSLLQKHTESFVKGNMGKELIQMRTAPLFTITFEYEMIVIVTLDHCLLTN